MSFSLNSRIVWPGSLRVVLKTSSEIQLSRSFFMMILMASNIIGRRSDQLNLDEIANRADLSSR